MITESTVLLLTLSTRWLENSNSWFTVYVAISGEILASKFLRNMSNSFPSCKIPFGQFITVTAGQLKLNKR